MRIESGFVGSNVVGPEWRLDDGTGERTADHTVVFSLPFSSQPSVVVGITKVDFDNSTQDHNFQVVAKRIEKTFFELEFRAQGDTKIRHAVVFWLAYGDEP